LLSGGIIKDAGLSGTGQDSQAKNSATADAVLPLENIQVRDRMKLLASVRREQV